MRLTVCSNLLLLILWSPWYVIAAEPVGEVTVMTGVAERLPAGGTGVVLKKGAPVYAQDRIVTAARSFIAVRFDDGTRFNLGPGSEFRIGEVRSGADGVFSAEVLRGAFRFVTGLIARQRPRAMQVRTGVVATIGIRGTTVGGEVVGESVTIVLLENEDGEPKASAIEVGNDHGTVLIDQQGYGTTVPDANSPPTPPARMSLRAIENLVRNINSIQRISVPRPTFR